MKHFSNDGKIAKKAIMKIYSKGWFNGGINLPAKDHIKWVEMNIALNYFLTSWFFNQCIESIDWLMKMKKKLLQSTLPMRELFIIIISKTTQTFV